MLFACRCSANFARQARLGIADGLSWLQVITGPNMSGKSCFLKAVGIIVFLAHVGSYVPAEAATVGLTDRLFTRMSSLQARAPLQSSFMSELSQIAAMLHCATQRQVYGRAGYAHCAHAAAAWSLQDL